MVKFAKQTLQNNNGSIPLKFNQISDNGCNRTMTKVSWVHRHCHSFLKIFSS